MKNDHKVTNQVVDIIFSHLIQTHLQEHDDGSDTCERDVIDLLVVGLQNKLTEGAAAVSVNLQEVQPNRQEYSVTITDLYTTRW